jgi:hypothetical protein
MTVVDLGTPALEDRLKLALLDRDGFASQDEILRLFTDVPREELKTARELIGARMEKDASSGSWYCVLPKTVLLDEPEVSLAEEILSRSRSTPVAAHPLYEFEVVGYRVQTFSQGVLLHLEHEILSGEHQGETVETTRPLSYDGRPYFFREMFAWGLSREFFVDGPVDPVEAVERAGEALVGLRAEARIVPYVGRSGRRGLNVEARSLALLA